MKKILLSLFTFVVALTSAFADEAKFDFTAPQHSHLLLLPLPKLLQVLTLSV